MTRRKREIVGLRNERDFPYLVELALPPGGFRSVFLEIDAFHRERRIPVRRGRSRHEVKLLGFSDIRKVVSRRNELVTRTENGEDGEPVTAGKGSRPAPHQAFSRSANAPNCALPHR